MDKIIMQIMNMENYLDIGNRNLQLVVDERVNQFINFIKLIIKFR